MTEPKPIPLPKPDKHLGKSDFHRFVCEQADRLEEAIGWLYDHLPHPLQKALEVADDAHDVIGDVPEPEVWGNGCECWVTPEHMWTTHYGAVEPGSQLEFNPECPKHGEAAS